MWNCKFKYPFGLPVILFVLTACSSLPENQYQDPYQNWNRTVYNLNEDFDNAVVRPVTQVYTTVTPDPVETGVRNFFANLIYPTVAINQFLQGKVSQGFKDVTRFALNTTIGIAGIFDVATDMGLPPQQEDFGQTFAKWGIGSGPYIVLPGLGGMTIRDGIGRAAIVPLNPALYIDEVETRVTLGVTAGFDRSASLLEARELISGDGYLFVRDAYLQRREFLVNDGAATEEDPFLDE